MGATTNAYKTRLRKREGKKQFNSPRNIWEDNIKMTLKDLGMRVWTGFNWLRTESSGRIL
jgi:hypothetical protein